MAPVGSETFHIGPVRFWTRFDTRDPHFALAVADADDIDARLRASGRPYHDFTDTPNGLRQLFVWDPDGNMIEFIGPTRERRARVMEPPAP